jgi:hypothetical protein
MAGPLGCHPEARRRDRDHVRSADLSNAIFCFLHCKFAFTADGRSLGALRQPRDDSARERFGLAFCFKALESAVDNR